MRSINLMLVDKFEKLYKLKDELDKLGELQDK